MKRIVAMASVMVAFCVGPALVAQSVRSAETQLRAAQHKEEVEGDLNGAIEQYKAVARSGNRALEATALVRMAECYRKLGDRQAHQIYEQVVQRYADQPEAVALAQARLNAGSADPPLKGDRAVWTGPKVDLFGRVSPDGRLISYVDWGVGDLAVHDVIANSDRALTSAGKTTKYEQFAEGSTISRDGKLVAYSWYSDKQVRELRVMPLRGGPSEPRTFFAGNADIAFIWPRDWSPDGKWIAASIQRTDGTGQLALIGVADGTQRVLKSAGWSGPERMFFSSDGRYIAYDLPASDSSDQRDVFIMAVDASREIRAVEDAATERVMGWSPDGTRILFTSDRTGTVGLWGLRVVDGKPEGSPELLRADIGGESLGITTSGALYLFKQPTNRDVRIAPIDVAAGKLGTPVSFPRGFVPDPRDPDWSPDGKFLAYQACGGDCIAVRSVESGDVRKVMPRRLLYCRDPQWSPDGRLFVVAGRDRNGRNGIFTVDVQNGDTAPIAMGPGFGSSPVWSKDGRRIYYSNHAIVERDIQSGAERKLSDRLVTRGISVSPDGRWIVARTPTDETSKTFALVLVPTDGAPVRELLQLPQVEEFGSTHTAEWTRDSQAVLVVRNTGQQAELLLVPINGTAPRALGIDPATWTEGAAGGVDRGFRLSPDGRHLAFLAGKTTAEVWAVENILPSRTSRR